jgi:hypothetical protein
MSETRYSDKQLEKSTQKFFLESAGFVIKLVFEPIEQVYFKGRLIDEVFRLWSSGGFLLSSSKKADFEIRFTDTNLIEVVHKGRKAKQFYLTFQRDFTSGKVIAYYHTSLPALQMLLKEVFTFLIKRDGFLLHASGCQSKSGSLKLFLAPSGGGKTTVATLLSKSKDIVQFNDDILIVRKMGGQWKFFSPPFVEKQILPVKREAKNAELFFIKKSKKAAKKEIRDPKTVLRLVLRQIWSKTGNIDRKTLGNAMVFVEENKFYWLDSILDAKALRKVVYEN